MKRLLIIAALTFSFIASVGTLLAQTADDNNEKLQKLQKQLDDMQAQMAAVQSEIKQLSGGATQPNNMSPASTQTATSEKKPDQSEAATELDQGQQREVGKETSAHVTFSQDEVAAPRVDNAPLDPRYPGYFRLPGTKTFLKIGGYFKTDFIRDIRQAGDTDRFIPSSIPIPAPAGVSNSTVSVRPTRLNLDFLIPSESLGKIRFFIEGDLFGSSSTTPRMRHAYAQARNLLIGQTFSNFMDPDSGPDQLDFQGPNGQVSIRNPQLRYSLPLGEKRSLRFSVEKASSDVAFKTPEFSSLPNSPAPDGAITFRQDMSSGHFQFSWLFRDIAAFLPNGVSDSTFGWGFNFTGLQKTVGKDSFTYQVAYGRGIERYFNDTSGLGIDAAPISTAEPRLRSLPVLGAYGSYQHFWVPKLRSNLIYGFAQVDNTAFQSGSTFHQSNYTAANLIWNVAGSLNVGAEFLYGWLVEKNGAKGNAPRLMISAKYNFVKSEEAKQ